jgi:hypothetical protein
MQLKQEQVGEEYLYDRACSGRLVIATGDFHQEHVEKMIRGNRRIKQKDITLKLEASEEIFGHIINPQRFRKFVPGGSHEN